MDTPSLNEAAWRNERKFYITPADALALRQRLRHLAAPDENAGPNGTYHVRSLYFDNPYDKAVREKLSGQSRCEKFRLRYYGGNPTFIRLEKKSKLKRLVQKQTAIIPQDVCAALLQGNAAPLAALDDPLCQELAIKMQNQCLRSRTIVDYHREAFVYAPGNVRITLDSNVRASAFPAGFLKPQSVTVPAANALILEVKYDEFLPDIMRDAVQLQSRHETEFSKYVVSRLAC